MIADKHFASDPRFESAGSDRSRQMSLVRSHGNKSTELRLISIFRAHYLSGWRRSMPLEGKPDFVFVSARLAIFVDGCFWHGCQWCYRPPKSNKQFWAAKVRQNVRRDLFVSRRLRRDGWSVMRIWEHSLKNESTIAKRVRAQLTRGAKSN